MYLMVANTVTETFTWFEKEIRELREDPRINLIVHCSVSAANSKVPSIAPGPEDSDLSGTSTVAPTPRRSLQLTEKLEISPTTSGSSAPRDPEKGGAWLSTSPSLCMLELQLGRPKVTAIVKRAVAEVGVDDRVAVGVCGPASLHHDTRDAVAACITAEGPSVTMHSETFGW